MIPSLSSLEFNDDGFFAHSRAIERIALALSQLGVGADNPALASNPGGTVTNYITGTTTGGGGGSSTIPPSGVAAGSYGSGAATYEVPFFTVGTDGRLTFAGEYSIPFLGTLAVPVFNNGGNARGTAAVDWQQARSAATQVASGDYATVLGGIRNTASGDLSVALGGDSCIASGYASMSMGNACEAAGNYSVCMGDSGVNDGDKCFLFSPAFGWEIGSSVSRSFAAIGGILGSTAVSHCAVLNGSLSTGVSSCTVVGSSIATSTYPGTFLGSEMLNTWSNSNGINYLGCKVLTGSWTGYLSNNIGCGYSGDIAREVAIYADEGTVYTHTSLGTERVVIGGDTLVDASVAITGSLYIDATIVCTGALGCNGTPAQTSYASGGAVAAGPAGAAYTATEQAMLNQLKTLTNNIRTALVNNGIMS